MTVTHEVASILLVEDDDATRHAIAIYLGGHAHDVVQAGDAASALEAWAAKRPDLIVLDLGLPDQDGLTVIRAVRREATTPILVLSARDRESDKVAALDLGADDYVTKPFGMAELRARIDALLRRAAGPAADASGIVLHRDLTLGVGGRPVPIRDRPVCLPPRENEVSYSASTAEMSRPFRYAVEMRGANVAMGSSMRSLRSVPD